MRPQEWDEQLEGREVGGKPRRWVCRCSEPPTLLATIEGNEANIKIRDRYYHIVSRQGSIQTIAHSAVSSIRSLSAQSRDAGLRSPHGTKEVRPAAPHFL